MAEFNAVTQAREGMKPCQDEGLQDTVLGLDYMIALVHGNTNILIWLLYHCINVAVSHLQNGTYII